MPTASHKVHQTPTNKKKGTMTPSEHKVLKAIKNGTLEADEDKIFFLTLVHWLEKVEDDTKMWENIV